MFLFNHNLFFKYQETKKLNYSKYCIFFFFFRKKNLYSDELDRKMAQMVEFGIFIKIKSKFVRLEIIKLQIIIMCSKNFWSESQINSKLGTKKIILLCIIGLNSNLYQNYELGCVCKGTLFFESGPHFSLCSILFAIIL